MLSARSSEFGTIKLQSARMQGTLLPCFIPMRAPVASGSGYEHEKQCTKISPERSIPACQPALTKDPASPWKMPMLTATLMSATESRPCTQSTQTRAVCWKGAQEMCMHVPQFPHLPILPSLIFLIPPVQLLVLVERGTPGTHLDHRPLPASASSMQANLSNPSPKFGGILPRALT